jgi:hypothetical protein
MGHDPSIGNEQGGGGSEGQNEEMVDARSIFIYKAVKKINPSLQILTEIFY